MNIEEILKKVDQKINVLRNEMTLNFRDLQNQNSTMAQNTKLVEMGMAMDKLQSQVAFCENQTLPKLEEVEKRIETAETKITTISEEALPLVLKSTVKTVNDGELKELYIQCDGLTYDLLGSKLNMGASTVSQYINDNRKSQEGRRAIYNFLTEHLKNANV